MNFFHWVEFTVNIPNVVVTNKTMAAIVQYGHGLFGHQSEVNDDFLVRQANASGWVLGAVDWLGLSVSDEVFAGEMVGTDLSNFPMIPDRCHQGMLNALILNRLLTQPSFYTDKSMTFDGRVIVDPTRR